MIRSYLSNKAIPPVGPLLVVVGYWVQSGGLQLFLGSPKIIFTFNGLSSEGKTKSRGSRPGSCPYTQTRLDFHSLLELRHLVTGTRRTRLSHSVVAFEHFKVGVPNALLDFVDVHAGLLKQHSCPRPSHF